MNREDIIRMAREASNNASGLYEENSDLVMLYLDELERFAALVAAAERERVARWQIGSGYTTGHGETIEDLLVELEWQVRESEREACAELCDELHWPWRMGDNSGPKECAAAIRARGQA